MNGTCRGNVDFIINSILEKIPRPNFDEFKSLYEEIDCMTREIGRILINSMFFDCNNMYIYFDRMNSKDIANLIMENPRVMVPFFIMICGFSERELERLYNVSNVYSLRERIDEERVATLSNIIRDHLRHPLALETIIYKFYKNWEEHQKRHIRAKQAEEHVREFLRKAGYSVSKIYVKCKDKRREIDCAILSEDGRDILVAIQVRTGVFRDLVKRAKEYSTEFDELMECYPRAKFVVIYFISSHEMDRLNEIRKRIEDERRDKRPYDLIVLRPEEMDTLLKKLEEWGIPKSKRIFTHS